MLDEFRYKEGNYDEISAVKEFLWSYWGRKYLVLERMCCLEVCCREENATNGWNFEVELVGYVSI